MAEPRRRPSFGSLRPLAAPVLIFTIVMALTLGLQDVSRRLIQVDLDQAATENCYKVITLVQARLQERMASIRRLADFLGVGREPPPAQFAELASLAMRDSPEVLGMVLAQTDGTPIRVQPAPDVSALEILDLCGSPMLAAPVEEALQAGAGKYALGRRMVVPGRGWGFAVVAPVARDGRVQRLLISFHAHDRLMASILAPQLLGEFVIELQQADHQVFHSYWLSAYNRPSLSGHAGRVRGVEDFFFVGPQRWRVRVETAGIGGSGPARFTGNAIVGLGTTLGLLIATFVWIQQRRAARYEAEAWIGRRRLASTGLSLVQIQENLNLILNNVNEAIVLYDEDFAPVQANGAFKRVFGAALGSDPEGPSAEEHHRAMASMFQVESAYRSLIQALREDPLQPREDRLALRDEEGAVARVFRRHGTSAFRPDGTRRGYLVVYEDVTDSLAAERMKEDFLSSVTHDLRTPLAAIKGFAETILRDRDMDPAVREEFAGIVRDEATRLEEMIEDLLDLRRMEEGRFDLVTGSFRMRALVEDIARSMRPILEAADLRLAIEWSGEEAPLHGDMEKLGRAVRNVLANAFKYSPAGSTIRVEGIESPDRVELVIADSGPGIPPEDLPHVFEKFYRGGRHVRRTKGTGLGLPITRRIVESHGGLVFATSDGRTGTTVRISLPRSSSASGEASGTDPQAAPGA